MTVMFSVFILTEEINMWTLSRSLEYEGLPAINPKVNSVIGTGIANRNYFWPFRDYLLNPSILKIENVRDLLFLSL